MAEQNPIRYADLISPDDSIERLITQLEQLQTAYGNMANSVKSQAQQVAASLQTVSGATEQGRKTIKESNDEAARLEKAYKQLDAALSNNAKEIAKLNIIRREQNNINKQMILRGKEEINTAEKIKNASYQQLSAQYSLNKAYINTLTLKQREQKENKELIKQSEQIYEQMKKLQEATGKHQLNVGNYPQLDGVINSLGSRLGVAGNLTSMLTSKTALLTGAIGATAAAVIAGTKAWADYNSEMSQQVNMATVITGLHGMVLDRTVASARSLSEVYDVDFREVISAANTLMVQFGEDAFDAMEILRDGMQGMIQGDGQKLLQMIQQYAPAFRDAGISASQLVAIIHNSEGGIFTPENMNAIVMGIKNIRLMTNSTADALEKIGVDGRKIAADLRDGTLTIFDALKIVSEALQEVEGSSQEAGEVMQQVFGRQGTAAGTNLAKAIESLNLNLQETKLQTGQVGEETAKLEKKTEEFENRLREVFGLDGWEIMALQLRTEVVKELTDVLDLAGDILDTMQDIESVPIFGTLISAINTVINPLGQLIMYLREIRNLGGGGSGSGTAGGGQGGGVRGGNYSTGGTTTITRTRTGGGGRTTPKKVDDTLKEQQKQQQDMLALQRKYEDTLLELIDDEFERERAKTVLNYDRQIEDLRRRLETEKNITEEYRTTINNQIWALEEAKVVKLNEITEKQVKKQEEADEKLRKEQEQARQLSLREQERAINLEYDIQREELEQLETSEKEKTRLRLEAEKERLQKLLDLYEKDGKKLSEKEVELIKKQIQGVEIELQKNDKQNRDIYDVLGFNLSDEKKQAIDASLQYAQDALASFMESYINAAEAKRQAADEEVARTQSVLQAEIEARANGYANEVETARKEYDNARKQQQKAIEQQRKAQKAKLLMDSISQVSNLVTATSLIWSQLGFPFAIPAIAVMWGSFAASKIMAASAVNGGDEEYGEGHVELLDGGSHQSGNDIDLGRKKDGTRRRAEGGEYFAVINKRNSRKYRAVIPDVINSLNAGTFAEKYMNAYDGGSINIQATQRNSDLTRLSDDVRSIREQGEHVTYVDGKGRTVVVYKNVKRIVN